MSQSFMNWSGGKDSSLCLYKAQLEGKHITRLVTTVNATHNRISMHGVRRELLEAQAHALKMPLTTLELPEQPNMKEYECVVKRLHKSLKAQGYEEAIYGDIFLEDLKKYRDDLLQKDGLKGAYPLWGNNSTELVKEFINLGFKAIVVCVQANLLPVSFCGREIDESFLQDLPETVDPFGENGEFHSFVFDGPLFTNPIAVKKGEVVYKEYKQEAQQDDTTARTVDKTGFYFCDLLPV